MQAAFTPKSSREPILKRLRRMGLILTGDQKLADGILQDAFQRARNADPDAEDISEENVLKIGFHAFDDAVHRKGVVVILNRAGNRDGSLGDHVNKLSYVERLAIALLHIEKMTPMRAASLSGRPASVLQEALGDAMQKLEIDEKKFNAG